MAELVCIDPAQVHAFWPYAEPLIRSAIERTELSDFQLVERDILSGNALLWLAWSGEIEAAAASQIVAISGKRVCIIVACGGDNRSQWLPLIAGIEQYAKDNGCTCIRIYGRKGWLRVLDGYQAKHVIMDKEL